MHTEQAASETWCPMVRYVTGVVDPAANRWGNLDNPTPCRCIASRCAMWRWIDTTHTAEMAGEARGFCGLAGRPS